MSLPSSALLPVSGVDWPMTMERAVTPGTCCAWADRAMAAKATKARRSMRFSPGRRLYRLTSVKAGGGAGLRQSRLPKITNGTAMPSDIEIAQAAKMKRIAAVAKEKLGIGEEHLEPYGHYKAKVSLKYLETLKGKKDGKLILVTAISPTPAGEGKTTTTVGLGDALNHIGKK